MRSTATGAVAGVTRCNLTVPGAAGRGIASVVSGAAASPAVSSRAPAARTAALAPSGADLPARDALALLQLSTQIHDLPPNPIVRHETMLRELCRLTDSAVGTCALLRASRDDVLPRRGVGNGNVRQRTVAPPPLHIPRVP